MHKSIASVFVAACCLTLMARPVAQAQDKPAQPPKKIEPAAVKLGRPVDFDRDVFPILDGNCIACHNSAVSEGKLNLEEVSLILMGGKRGPAVVPKDPDKSNLFLFASHSQNPIMPPPGNKVEADPLTPEQLGIIRLWILEGAASGKGGTTEHIDWQPIPPGLHAIYSVALSPWGQYVATGHVNQITLHDVETGEQLDRLTDPELLKVQRDGKPLYPAGAAHRDFVHSLAFSPDGMLLASGDYRMVRLWRRSTEMLKSQIAATGDVTALAASADQRWLAIALGDNNSIALVNGADGKTERILSGHTAKITALEFWPSVDEKVRVERTVTAAQHALQAAQTKADDARKHAESTPKDAKSAEQKTAADKELQAAQNTLKAAADAKAAFDAKLAQQTILVSASLDKSIHVWNPADGAVKRKIAGIAAVNDLALNSDATRVISADADGKLRLWDAAPAAAPAAGAAPMADKPLLELAGHEKPVTAVATVFPDGTRVVSGSEDGSVRLWNLADGKQILSMAHGGPVTSVAVRPDGQAAASAGANNITRLWQLSDGKQLAEIKGSIPLARKVVTVTEDQTVAKQKITLADAGISTAESQVKDRTEAAKKADEAKTAAGKAVEEAQAKLKADNDKLAAAKAALAKKTDDKQLMQNVAEAEKAAKAQEEAAKKAVEAQAAAGKAKERADQAAVDAGKQLETAKQTKTAAEKSKAGVDAQLAEAQKGSQAAEKPILAVAFSPDGRILATAGDDGAIQLYAARTGAPADVTTPPGPRIAQITFASTDALISAAADRKVSVWNTVPKWTLAARLGTTADKPLDVSASPFVGRVLALDFSRDGKLLATGGGEPSRSGELKIWDVAQMKLVRDIKDAHSDTVMGVEFSRDGAFLLSGAADKFVKLFNVATGKHVRSFEGHTHHVLDVSWRSDGAVVASAGADNAVKVWNVETGEQIRTIDAHGKQVTSLAFLGVSDTILTTGGDSKVSLHQSTDGKAVRDFAGATDFVYASAGSRDQRLVVAGGEDGMLRIWNGQDAKVLAVVSPAP